MTAQILAAVIFVGMFALIIMDKVERQYVTLGSAALVLVVVFGICMHSWDAIKKALNLGAFFRTDFWYGASESSGGINWSTIVFIAGMMVMVEGMAKAGFFRWLCLTLAKLVHYRTVPLLICFMSLSAFLSPRTAVRPRPSAMMNGTVMGPVVTPPESKATAQKSGDTNIASVNTTA